MSTPAFRANPPFLPQPSHQAPMHLTPHPFHRPRFLPPTLGGALGLLLLLLQGCQSAPPPVEPAPARAVALKLSSAKCVWPEQPQRAVVGGTTRLRYTIDASGKVNRVEIVQSAGDTEEHKKLDRLSLSVLSTCVFPANPAAVGVVQQIEFDYVL